MTAATAQLPVGASEVNPVLSAASEWLAMVPLAPAIALPIAAVIGRHRPATPGRQGMNQVLRRTRRAEGAHP